MDTNILGTDKEVVIGDGRPTVLIGERINPTGKKKMQEALKQGNFELIRQVAVAQIQAGAHILDVNVATSGVDEISLLPKVVSIVQETVDVPLCLDSPNPEALAEALKICKGRPIVNSVTGEEHSLAKVLPLVKEYGVAVIALPQDESGVSQEAEKRTEIAAKIIDRAGSLGIPPNDIIIDCIAFAVGAEPKSGFVALKTIESIKAKYGVNLTLAASNVSFGMPDRGLLNNAFATMAIACGANSFIADVAKLRPAILAADLILGYDQYARLYIQSYRQRQKESL